MIKQSAEKVEYPDKKGANLFILTEVGNARLGLVGGLGSWGKQIVLTTWMVLLTFVVFIFK